MDASEEIKAPLLSYEKVRISHGNYTVIDGVTFTIDSGDFVFLTGSTGTGKSSIMRTIYGDMKISDGKASVLGYNLREIKKKQIPELRRQLGIIFQDYKLLGNKTVRQNLYFCLKATGQKDRKKADERIDEILSAVALEGKDDKLPSELSGGEQQRAAIARAIINKPKIILADEPTGNLDFTSAMNITSLLKRLSDVGTAVIMSTHSSEIINNFKARTYLCKDHSFEEITSPCVPSESDNQTEDRKEDQ